MLQFGRKNNFALIKTKTKKNIPTRVSKGVNERVIEVLGPDQISNFF